MIFRPRTCRSVSALSRCRICAKPRMPFSGVRSSWLICARNSLRWRASRSASASAASRAASVALRSLTSHAMREAPIEAADRRFGAAQADHEEHAAGQREHAGAEHCVQPALPQLALLQLDGLQLVATRELIDLALPALLLVALGELDHAGA